MTKDELIDQIAADEMFLSGCNISSPDNFDDVHPIRTENIYNGLMAAFRAGQEWNRRK